MALFEEIEPPSHGDTEKIKKVFFQVTKIKNYFYQKFKLTGLTWFLNKGKSLFSKVNFSIIDLSFFKNIIDGRYLPHSILVLISLVVVGSNINDKIIARAYSNNIIEIQPGTGLAVIQNVDYFTPLIPADGDLFDKSVTTISADGFGSASGSVQTVLTAREEPLPDNSLGEVTYIIRNGDTLSGLGLKFGVKIATLKYVNDIENINTLKPGSKIKVPKQGYEVSASLIAKKENDRLAKLAVASRNTYARSNTSGRSEIVKASTGSRVNGYPYGYCTYYVATRRQVPSSWGDAKAWLNSAKRAGYSTGSSPVPGAIMVSSESWWGHVAFVESVDGDQITVSEMNYKGWGIASRRTLSKNDRVVRGFIY